MPSAGPLRRMLGLAATRTLHLVPIERKGTTTAPLKDSAEVVGQVIEATVALFITNL
jgi:hypothetical protein